MEIPFRYRGRRYNQNYAYVPTKVTSGNWVWLTTYYSRDSYEGWISLTPLEFIMETALLEKEKE